MMPSIGTAQPEGSWSLGRVLSHRIDETSRTLRIHSPDDDREPVGFLFERNCHMGALCIARRARGRGIGERLPNRAKQRYPKIYLRTFENNRDKGQPNMRLACIRGAHHA